MSEVSEPSGILEVALERTAKLLDVDPTLAAEVALGAYKTWLQTPAVERGAILRRAAG